MDKTPQPNNQSTTPQQGELVSPSRRQRQEQREQRRIYRRTKRRRWQHKDANNGEASFAAGLNLYKLFWVFLIGSFFGVVFETLYVYFMDGVWMNRAGMLYGPFNQVYGIGAVLFTVLLYRFRHKNALVIFTASAIIGGVFEYACSWVQQLAFGSVSWEYSDMPANIGGRTNLYYAGAWGLMGLIFITHAWPFLSEHIERIPNTIGKSLTIVLAVLMLADLTLSGAAVFRASRRAENIPATNTVARWLDETYPDSYLKKAYPSMQFVGRDGAGKKTEEQGEDGKAPADSSATESNAA